MSEDQEHEPSALEQELKQELIMIRAAAHAEYLAHKERMAYIRARLKINRDAALRTRDLRHEQARSHVEEDHDEPLDST